MKSKLIEAKDERAKLETENNLLIDAYRESCLQYRDNEATLFKLGAREAELSAQLVGLNHLCENIVVSIQ